MKWLPSLLLVAACSATDDPLGPGGPAGSFYFPPTTGTTWISVSPAAAGWDSVALAGALDWAGARGTTAVIVLWRGRIVAERYWRGWTTETDSIIASAGKSVTSVLAGTLIAEGRLRLDDPVRQYLGPGWSRSPATEAGITLRHLLSMSSGLDDSLKAVVTPGTRFYYNNPAYYQLFGILAAAARTSLQNLSQQRLFTPIGMGSATWRPNLDTGQLGYILSCTARDMARFGLLVLNRGRWDGQLIVADTAWLAASLRSQAPDNPAYGWLWWLNGTATYRIPGPYSLPTLAGPAIPSAPPDLIAALGKGDKKIYLVPSLDLVVVRHGDEADPLGNPFALSGFDEQFWQRLKPAFRLPAPPGLLR
jgi:CubicO group peptidase (beta-lactamase class C family)